jgi:hypothetical protein
MISRRFDRPIACIGREVLASICGLVRSGVPSNRLIEPDSWPCAEKRSAREVCTFKTVRKGAGPNRIGKQEY